MAFFPDRATFVQIGSLSIQWYAIFIVTGAIIAYLLSLRNFKKMHIDKEVLEDFFINALLVGIIGARIWYVIFSYNEIYAHRDWIDMFKIWEGGLAIQGGVIFATIYGVYYFKKHHVDIWRAADCIMPNLLVAQAIGRWGNFMNQEAHGTQVDLSFLEGWHLPQFIIDGMEINGRYYHPTFLYESVGNLIVFAIIVLLVRRFYHRHGTLFFSYFIGYSIVRFFVEALRTDSLMLGSLRMAQVTSIACIIIGIGSLIYLHFKGEKVTSETRL